MTDESKIASAEPSEECNLAKATAFVERLVYCAGTQQSVATGYLRDILDVLKGGAAPNAPVERDLDDDPFFVQQAEPSEECAHSYANKAGCPECGEAFDGGKPNAPNCKYCGDTGQFMVGNSGDASDGNAPVMARCEDCELGEPNVPIELKALRAFVGAAYPVASEINKRGYNWCETYLDDALALARAALERKS